MSYQDNINPVHHLTTSDGVDASATGTNIERIGGTAGEHHRHNHPHHHTAQEPQPALTGRSGVVGTTGPSAINARTEDGIIQGYGHDTNGVGTIAGTAAGVSAVHHQPSPIGSASTTGIATSPATHAITPAQGHTASAVNEPSTGRTSDTVAAGRDGPLSNAQGPLPQTVLQRDSEGGGVPSSIGGQTAPGKAGSVGEKAMGVLGYGGTHVERPKEEQGLGEKIVNFLGV